MSKSLDAYWKWNVTWLTQKWEEVQMIFSEKEMCSRTHEKQPQSWDFFFFFFSPSERVEIMLSLDFFKFQFYLPAKIQSIL